MNINIQPISNVLGVLLFMLGSAMMLCIGVSFIYESGDAGALFNSGGITMAIGALLWKYKFSNKTSINKREGYLIVFLAWLSMAMFAALPYYFSGVTSNVTDAFFEATSGVTTTGATILTDLEVVPKGILFWRSLTQWIGGMGIIVLTIALFPLLGIGGIKLFLAEAPGPTADKIHPRIKETAKRLWYLYLGLTIVLFLLLWLEGMTPFDAINHAFTTTATGGFSTKNESIAFFTNPWIHYTIIFFMLACGTNFIILYYLFKGRVKDAFSNEEFKLYGLVVFIFAVIVSISIYYLSDSGMEESIRKGLFQVVSIITTTGYVSFDYTSLSAGIVMLFFVLLFTGGCAGSTSGGIKLIRHLIFLKNSVLEFKRLLHPRALIRIKLNHAIVAPRILTHILVFLMVYLFTFVVGAIILSFLGLDFITAVAASASAIGNVGPAVGDVGPMDNFADLPQAAKRVLAFLMIMGRLELFTVLILFTPFFWRAN